MTDFAGTPEQLDQVRENLMKSDWIGRIVANDQTAAMVVATLQENDPDTGQRLDLQEVAKALDAYRAVQTAKVGKAPVDAAPAPKKPTLKKKAKKRK